jgi:hypothetical protein
VLQYQHQQEQQQQQEQLQGFAVLTDTPKTGASEAWLDWFSETYAPAEAEARVANTLWADFIAGPQDGDGGAVESLMRTVSCSTSSLPNCSALSRSFKRETALC